MCVHVCVCVNNHFMNDCCICISNQTFPFYPLSLPQPLACLGTTVTGIDPVEESIAAAQQHSGSDPAISDRIKYLCCSTDQLLAANPETMFNCVVASEVIEHVTKKRTFLQEVSQLVKVLHVIIHALTHSHTHTHTHTHTVV